MKTLIIHGWYHSKKMYEKLANDLGNCHTIDLPGFGDENYTGELSEIEEFQVNYIKNIISEYDYVIAHSWGCRILLQSLEKTNCECILLNPAYGFNDNLKFLQKNEQFIYKAFKKISQMPKKSSTYIIKLLSLTSVNKWSQINDILVDDIRRASPEVATEILIKISTTDFRVKKDEINNKLHLIYSDKDRAVNKKCFEQIKNDLILDEYKFSNVGHTLVLEDYENLFKTLDKIINKS